MITVVPSYQLSVVTGSSWSMRGPVRCLYCRGGSFMYLTAESEDPTMSDRLIAVVLTCNAIRRYTHDYHYNQ